MASATSARGKQKKTRASATSERSFASRARELDSTFNPGTVRGFLLAIALLALVSLIYLGQNGQAAITGRRTQDLTTKLERVQRENAQLEVQIAQASLPSKIADRAKALGFRPATVTQTVFVVVKDFPPEPTLAAHSASGAPEGPTALWNNLLTVLGLGPTGKTVEATGP